MPTTYVSAQVQQHGGHGSLVRRACALAYVSNITSLYVQVNTLDSGEIDYDDLKARLAANKARPAIINVNIGTTVKGAVDDLDRVLDILEETGYTEDR